MADIGVKQIGRYEILSELGRGSMGVVFKAKDPMIERFIAVKTITASVADDPGLLARFRREAKAAGALQHPNIVTIYEMGEADGVPFIAMEYLEGESLEAMISRRASLPVEQKVGYLVQTCRALQYAHRRGVIHRDIKPANIVVTLEGVVKVVDFGIARMVNASKTQTGIVLGTLAYMAPQQIQGERADARSDIWSVGVVLYELLTGRRPFEGDNHASLMLSILQKDPVPLPHLLPGCPNQLDTISRRTLAKDLAARYQSMEELLLELKSAWAALNLNKSGKAPAARDEYAHQSVASRAKTQVARPAASVPPRKQPARITPSNAFGPMRKATPIPSASVTATVLEPKPSSPSPGPANLASAKPLSARPWQRGIVFAALGLTVLAGIVVEAHRVRVHSSTKTSRPLASDTQQPSSSAGQPVPATVNAIEGRSAGDAKATPDAQFNSAVTHFKQAVAAKDAASLKLRVWPEFEEIAQQGGPHASDAQHYISSAIPTAVRNMTPWPSIGCGVALPDRESEFEFNDFVACGLLDPRLRWVQFSWPEFPERARQAGLSSGVAMLYLTVDERGAIVEARSRVKPDSFGFTTSAIHAALKWKTTAPIAYGSPARTQLSVDVPFGQ